MSNNRSQKEVEIKARFKSVDLFNKTIHIILYPEDGLRVAVKLQEIEEGTPVTLTLQFDGECTS